MLGEVIDLNLSLVLHALWYKWPMHYCLRLHHYTGLLTGRSSLRPALITKMFQRLSARRARRSLYVKEKGKLCSCSCGCFLALQKAREAALRGNFAGLYSTQANHSLETIDQDPKLPGYAKKMPYLLGKLHGSLLSSHNQRI